IDGTLLEVRADRPRMAAAALRRALPEHAVSLFGERVHVVSRQADETRSTITATLAGEGIGLASLAEAEPSLEDVFIAVIGAQEGSDHARLE
ncbi:MAG: ABC transporter ATP-binding protein, partial [Thermoanaerobaculia bacterium]|nr:ABC transporter ATP-binding protein [Thermoanaerobaculia bacterium]